MASPRATLVCQGCGWEALPTGSPAFRCPNQVSGDDIDHLLAVRWANPGLPRSLSYQSNPFLHFREMSFGYANALEHGLTDAGYQELVLDLDQRVADVCGVHFVTTPLERDDGNKVWYKDETGNVGGSHKARHLFGLALYLDVLEHTGQVPKGQLGSKQFPLAIASCGNAALAAAIVAKAAHCVLQVFLPTWADGGIVEELKRLGALVVVCERRSDSPPGDPCFHAFRNALDQGAVPFSCQGSENGLTIDGGMTLGFELAGVLAANKVQLDRLFLQVGGGALASSTCQAIRLAMAGVGPLPAIHAVQTSACPPLALAWRKLANDMKIALPDGASLDIHEDDRLASWLHRHLDPAIAEQVFQKAKHNRSTYMQPVPTPASSIADGILDDETYDWFVVCRAMIETGGWPILVGEDDLRWARGAASSINARPVSATGAAGLAGVRAGRRAGQLCIDDEIGVLFTGVERSNPDQTEAP